MEKKTESFLKYLDSLIERSRPRDLPEPEPIFFREYVEMVYRNPGIAALAPERVFNAILKYGAEEVVDYSERTEFLELFENLDGLLPIDFSQVKPLRFLYFKEHLFGLDAPIYYVMLALKAGAKRSETGKRILLLMGPPGGGKSTFVALLERALELDSESTPVFAIKGCPFHEEPLHLLRRSERAEFERNTGIEIEGDLCPLCRHRFKEEWQWDINNVPIIQIRISERSRVGIGRLQPTDPKSQDISEFIGWEDLPQMTRFGRGDPRSWAWIGEIMIASRGILEPKELLKFDEKVTRLLLTLNEEKRIKVPGFEEIYVDCLVLTHTNQFEYENFVASGKHEALQDRMYVIEFPYPLQVGAEEKHYRKAVRQSEFWVPHFCFEPHTFEVAARAAVASRLTPSSECPDMAQKAAYYNGEIDLEGEAVDLLKLRQEGERQGEGMSGFSPRLLVDALNTALAEQEEKGCITPIYVLRSIVTTLNHHIVRLQVPGRRGSQQEAVTGRDVVKGIAEFYWKQVDKEVKQALTKMASEETEEIFAQYLEAVAVYCNKEAWQELAPDIQQRYENLMRSLEAPHRVVGSKDVIRRKLADLKQSQEEKGQHLLLVDYDVSWHRAVVNTLFSRMKNELNKWLDEPDNNQRKLFIAGMKEMGYHSEEFILTLLRHTLARSR